MELEQKSVQNLKADVIDNKESLQQFSDLLDTCFVGNSIERYLDDFPVWDARFGVYPLLRVGVFKKDLLVSCSAVRMAKVHTTEGGFANIALIGAVATLPAWRGIGLASRSISLAVQWAKEQGASMVLLWSDQKSLYNKIGFVPFGVQAQVMLRDLELNKAYIKEEIREGWNSEIFDLLKQRGSGLLLEEGDRKWYQAHSNVEWSYVIRDGKVCAYAGFGRGIDLSGIVHEWGGDSSKLSGLLAYIREKKPGSVILGPEDRLAPFLKAESFCYRGELCLAKILDPSRASPNFWIWGLDAA